MARGRTNKAPRPGQGASLTRRARITIRGRGESVVHVLGYRPTSVVVGRWPTVVTVARRGGRVRPTWRCRPVGAIVGGDQRRSMTVARRGGPLRWRIRSAAERRDRRCGRLRCGSWVTSLKLVQALVCRGNRDGSRCPVGVRRGDVPRRRCAVAKAAERPNNQDEPGGRDSLRPNPTRHTAILVPTRTAGAERAKCRTGRTRTPRAARPGWWVVVYPVKQRPGIN
jgi:hypothetical protein